jgi:hypothetical protein
VPCLVGTCVTDWWRGAFRVGADSALRARNTFGTAREPHATAIRAPVVLAETPLGSTNSLLHSELLMTAPILSISTFLAPLPGRASQGNWDDGLG